MLAIIIWSCLASVSGFTFEFRNNRKHGSGTVSTKEIAKVGDKLEYEMAEDTALNATKKARRWWARQRAVFWDAETESWAPLGKYPGAPCFEKLLQLFIPRPKRSMFAINIGANDGKSHDPVYPLFNLGYGGIALEASEKYRKILDDNLAAANASGRVYGVIEPATPRRMPELFSELKVPKHLDALKIDIDSFDFAILRSIFDAGYRPKIVMMEVNLDIPPPYKWYVDYSDDFKFGHPQVFEHGIYGVSSAALFSELQEKRGYSFVGFDFGGRRAREHNMWFVRSDFYKEPAVSWKGMTRMFWAYNPYKKSHACHHMKKPHCPLKDLQTLAEDLGTDKALSPSEKSWSLTQESALPRILDYGSSLNTALAKQCAGVCHLWFESQTL